MIEYAVKVFDNGDKSWCLNGKLHREDGPAVEYNNGEQRWYLNGEHLTEEEFNHRMKLEIKEMTIAELEAKLGYPIKIVKD